MPIDYSKAKIYCIRSPNTDLIYIGATCQQLSQRMSTHRATTNKTNSKVILEFGDAYIELLENYPCNNKEELSKKEGEHIRSRNCCNKQIAGRTKSEWKKDNIEDISKKGKEYYEANKEAIGEQKKQYVKSNKEAISEQRKQFREANKEKIAEQKKKCYEANKEAISEQQRKYREANREAILAQKKKHYEANKEAILERNRQYKERKAQAIPVA